MPIQFDAEHRVFKLDSESTSYAIQIGPFDYLLHLYYGPKISDTDLGYLSYTCYHSSVSPYVVMDKENYFSKDVFRMEYSGNGCGDFRGSALSILRSTGTNDTDIKYVSHKIYAGKPKLPGLPATYAEENEADTLELCCMDAVSGAEVTLFYTVFRNYGAMTRHTVVRNTSNEGLELQRVMSLCMDLHDAREMDLIHLWGNWAKERSAERMPLMHCTQMIGSKRGTSSHMHNPFLTLCSHTATEQQGEAYGFNLVYSGNFTASAEMDPDGGTRVLMGINPEGFSWHLEPGESFCTPEVVMVYSNEGLGGMSRIYHRLYRNNLCRGPWKNKKRPILVNNWEGTYFDFDEEKLYNIAKAASEVGIEMLVMDDGWFGDRNSDTCALGDWFVNEQKLKGGLKSLVDRVNGLGMKFGIWFEPEMISPNSELYRRHPEWALQIPGRAMSISRHQYVLDMSRRDVQDYLFDCMKKVMDSANITYIKWDFNRNLTEVGSGLLPADRQQEVFHRYVLGLYSLLERLLEAYPDLLLEGCAGGGGRFDAGMLYYSPQIWTSDDTDAIERLDIQYGTSLCYPTSSMGAHVSAIPNHQLHRNESLRTRGNVAMAGTFGYELDLTKATEEEKAIMREQCADYHKYYNVIHRGDLYRLISPLQDRCRCCWSYVSADKSEALVTYVVIRAAVQDRYYIKLQGLDPKRHYRLETDGHPISGKILSGAALMNAGFCLAGRIYDQDSAVFHFVAVD